MKASSWCVYRLDGVFTFAGPRHRGTALDGADSKSRPVTPSLLSHLESHSPPYLWRPYQTNIMHATALHYGFWARHPLMWFYRTSWPLIHEHAVLWIGFCGCITCGMFVQCSYDPSPSPLLVWVALVHRAALHGPIYRC